MSAKTSVWEPFGVSLRGPSGQSVHSVRSIGNTFPSTFQCCHFFSSAWCLQLHPSHSGSGDECRHLCTSSYLLVNCHKTTDKTTAATNAVARKRSRSFCQKCRWQVTAKHAYTLPMWLCHSWLALSHHRPSRGSYWLGLSRD